MGFSIVMQNMPLAAALYGENIKVIARSNLTNPIYPIPKKSIKIFILVIDYILKFKFIYA